MSKKIKYTDEPMELTVIPDFLPPPGTLRKSMNAPRLTYTKRGDKVRMSFMDRPIKRRVKALGGIVLEYDATGILVGVVFSEGARRFVEPERTAPTRGGGHKTLHKAG